MINEIDVAFFDIDGTLHQGDTIWEAIHKKNNTWESHGRKYLQQYLAGEIGFEKFAYLDVATWKGLSEAIVQNAAKEMILFPEAKALLKELRKRNIDVYLVSNSLSHVAKQIVYDFKLNGYVANDLVIVDGQLIGDLIINIKYVDKGKQVKNILTKNKYKKAMAIGDGENDISMLAEVEYPILYNARRKNFSSYSGVMFYDWESINRYVLR